MASDAENTSGTWIIEQLSLNVNKDWNTRNWVSFIILFMQTVINHLIKLLINAFIRSDLSMQSVYISHKMQEKYEKRYNACKIE